MESTAIVSETQNDKDTNPNMCEQKMVERKEGLQSEFYDSLVTLEKAICNYEENTQSNFIIRQKSKHFGKEDFKPDSKSKILWQSPAVGHEVVIKFTGVPYMSVGRKSLMCHLGKDFGVGKKQKYALQRNTKQTDDHSFLKRRQMIQHTKKLDCTAEIHISHILRFPDFKIMVDTERRRKNAAKKIKAALLEGKIEGTHAYVCKFPLKSEHAFHATVGELANIREKVDPRIQMKIISLYREGVRKTSEMLRHLNSFVTQELFPGGEAPAESRRRFYPTRKDISNIMFKAKSEGRNSSIDQENVLQKLNQWQKETPEVSIYCRPNTSDETDKNKFLFCYQAEWQKKLLLKYGNQITLLDATYRTTRYALPLFFLCVRTNVCYAVVGAFVTQQETSACILEALNVFKTWNTDWKPIGFLVDFCQEEIHAICELFPETKILLCDFHREKAWLEWVNKKDHGTRSYRNIILKMLRNISNAANMEEHKIALSTLQSSEVWNSNAAVRQWFSKKWMPEIKKWAHVYRTGMLNFGINTNNGLERQNENLKYNFLDGYKNCSLSEMITVLHCNFFPSTYKKYVELNLKSSQYYRKYRDDIPDFLKNRPRDVIKRVMDKMSSNLDESDITCINNERGIFKVNSETEIGKMYDVNLTADPPLCTCHYWKKFLLPCKHMCCIFKFADDWGWEKLNPSYSNNPVLTLDTDLLDMELTTLKHEAEEFTRHDVETSKIQLAEFTPRRRTKKTTLIRSCVQNLKSINDAIYLIDDNAFLETLDSKIQEMRADVELKIPKEGGLPLHPTKKKQEPTLKFKALPSRLYGKPKNPASQRVGVKAEMLRLDVWQSVESQSDTDIDQSEVVGTVQLQSTATDDTWVSVRGIRLTFRNKEEVVTGQWLDDNVINVCQHLMSVKFPSVAGLFDTVSMAHSDIVNIAVDNVVQIHHLGAHWVVSHCSKQSVTIYDSLKPFQIVDTLKNQIAKLYAPLFVGENKVLDVHFKCCQQQHGASDCGAFSVANAVSLAYGVHLNSINFNQHLMREHLIRCIEEQEITMFPHDKVKPKKKIYSRKIKMTTFCLCKIYRDKEVMIECSHCKLWFHLDCVGLSESDKCVTTKKKYFCKKCSEKNED